MSQSRSVDDGDNVDDPSVVPAQMSLDPLDPQRPRHLNTLSLHW